MNNPPSASSATNENKASLVRPQAGLVRRLKDKPYDLECKKLFFKFLKSNDFHPDKATDILMAIFASTLIGEKEKTFLIMHLLINGAVFSKKQEKNKNTRQKIGQVRSALLSFLSIQNISVSLGDEEVSSELSRDIVFFRRWAFRFELFFKYFSKFASVQAIRTQHQGELTPSAGSKRNKHLLECIYDFLVNDEDRIKENKGLARFLLIIQGYRSVPPDVSATQKGLDLFARLPIELKEIIFRDIFVSDSYQILSDESRAHRKRAGETIGFFLKNRHIDWNQFPQKRSENPSMRQSA